MFKNILLLLLALIIDLVVTVGIPSVLVKVAVSGIFGLDVSVGYYILLFIALRLLMYDYKNK